MYRQVYLKPTKLLKHHHKTLVVKGVPTEVSEKDFKVFLDLNKIIYAKAECLTSKKDGRVLQMFKLEIKDEAEAEALILQNLTCHNTGTIYKVEEFRSPVSVQQEGGGISVSSFSTAVLELPKFLPFGKNM